jgi:hypothetical protein
MHKKADTLIKIYCVEKIAKQKDLLHLIDHASINQILKKYFYV